MGQHPAFEVAGEIARHESRESAPLGRLGEEAREVAADALVQDGGLRLPAAAVPVPERRDGGAPPDLLESLAPDLGRSARHPVPRGCRPGARAQVRSAPVARSCARSHPMDAFVRAPGSESLSSESPSTARSSRSSTGFAVERYLRDTRL